MRVYYHEDIDSMIVEGSRDVYPAKSLNIALVGEYIEVWLIGENMRLLGPVHWTRLSSMTGDAFISGADALAYMTTENEKGATLESVPDLTDHFETSIA